MPNIDPTSPGQLTQLFRRYNFRPRKRFGQNFLVDVNILNKILDAAEIGKGDPVLEIGPGAGALTLAAAGRGAHVVAVEVDRELVRMLEEVLAGTSVEIVNEDFLRLDLPAFLSEKLGDSKVKVLGNLPYYITSPIITEVLQVRSQVETMVLMVQREVADRLKASPGTKNFGSMSVFVQFYAEPQLIAPVSRNVFYPPPDVSSAIVRLTPRTSPPVEVPSEQLFFDVVHCAFGQRRKSLINSLSDCQALGFGKEEVGEILRGARIDPTRRAETLSLEEFGAISRAAAARQLTGD